jgi:hypothetical protein
VSPKLAPHVPTFPATLRNLCAGGSAPSSNRSFTGYARPSGPRWRLSTRSKPALVSKHLKTQRLDEHGADLIAAHREPAAGAVVLPLGQILGRRITAYTGLAGVAWLHSDGPPPGSRRLADKDRDELAPRGVTDRLGQPLAASLPALAQQTPHPHPRPAHMPSGRPPG